MIAEPLNDRDCLARLSIVAAQATMRADVRALASRFRSTGALVEWLRSLAQRDDGGDAKDGPRVACDVDQRARIAPVDPNCVERALTYLALAELIDRAPIRRLVTVDLMTGRHTFPVEDGEPVVLDPRENATTIHASLWALRNAMRMPRLGASDRALLDWIGRIAIDPAIAAHGQEGLRRVQNARQAIQHVIDGHRIDAVRTAKVAADVAYTLEQAAPAAALFGPAGVAGVGVAGTALELLGLVGVHPDGKEVSHQTKG